MKKIAVFAGSFDPFTLGHLDIVKRGALLFDELWVLIAKNSSKQNFFQDEMRLKWVEKSVSEIDNVKVDFFSGLTIDFLKKKNGNFLIRGIRNSKDLEYEQSVAWNNQILCPEVETIFLSSKPEHLSISSSIVRELLISNKNNSNDIIGNLSKFIPVCYVNELIYEYEKLK